MSKIVNLKSVKLSCAQCSLSKLCLPRGINTNDIDLLTSIVKLERILNKGETLFELGQPFKSLYAIRSGSMKVFLPTKSGDEHVVGFHMPGELLGFDAMAHDEHTCSSVALETTNICELPYNKLHELSQQVPSLSDHFMALMSNEIADEHSMMLMLGKKNADERIATFLLNMSVRYNKRGFSATQFNLSMSRYDISNYLGLAVETISRVIKHMQNKGVIEVERRYFKILDMTRLREIAGIAPDTRCPQLEKNVD